MVASGQLCDSHSWTGKDGKIRSRRTYRYIDESPVGQSAILSGAKEIKRERWIARIADREAKT